MSTVISQRDAMHLFMARMRTEGCPSGSKALEEGIARGWIIVHSLGDALVSADAGIREAAASAEASEGVLEFTQEFLDAVLPGARYEGS